MNKAPRIHYVGSKTCAFCHADIYREYLRTATGRSMVLPSGGSVHNLPPTPVTIHISKFDRDYKIFSRGAVLYQSESEPSANGSAVFRDRRRIAFVIGAGQNGMGFLVQKGNYLFEAPLSYYARSCSWELSPGYRFGDYGFSRAIPAACITCHSGRPRPIPGRIGLYENPPFKELAIGCENCHGPGELHVEERMKGEPLKGAFDHSILNPKDLPGWLADNICMICHEGGDTRVLQPGKTYLDFRPGSPLDNTIAIFAVPFTQQSPPRTPLLQQYTQMTFSKCYIESHGKMTCITCHDPHFEPTAAQSPAYFREKCLICHTERSCRLPLIVRLRKSPSNDCAGCHMVRQKLQHIFHSALTNHRIIAYPGEPFPNKAFHMTTTNLPDLVYLDAVPGKQKPALPPLTLLRAYGELLVTHPEYTAHYDQLLDRLARIQPHNPFVLSALGACPRIEFC